MAHPQHGGQVVRCTVCFQAPAFHPVAPPLASPRTQLVASLGQTLVSACPAIDPDPIWLGPVDPATPIPPGSTHYRLLLGTADGKRDRFDVGHVVTSLFLMEIDQGGTNHPHHHINAEEIYLVMSGHGDEAAGSGTDGIEQRRPAKPGDAYFYRANATVGYYSAPGVQSRILCVRSWHPGMAPNRSAGSQ